MKFGQGLSQGEGLLEENFTPVDAIANASALRLSHIVHKARNGPCRGVAAIRGRRPRQQQFNRKCFQEVTPRASDHIDTTVGSLKSILGWWY